MATVADLHRIYGDELHSDAMDIHMSEPETISADEYNAKYAGKQPKPSKYKNVKTTIDGIAFDSKREARRYCELKLQESAGELYDLVLQPRFPIIVEGHKICTYVADFAYYKKSPGEGSALYPTVEDAKGVRTREYRIKKKLMWAVHGIEILEV